MKLLRQDDGCIVGPDNYRSLDGSVTGGKSHDSLGHFGCVF